MALVKFDRGIYRNGNKAKGLAYGQIEPNQVWFDRAGMVEAQSRLDPREFSDSQVAPLTKFVAESALKAGDQVKIVAQNGAFLQVDKHNYLAQIPTIAGKTAGLRVGINYSSEKLYNQFAPQRRNFFLTTQDWLPRIGYVEAGMRITTNTVQWDTTASISALDYDGDAAPAIDFATFATSDDSYDMWLQVKNYLHANPRTPLYAAVRDGSDGEFVIGITPNPQTDIVLAQVVAAYDNADRTCSFMFQILDGGTK
ncbi:MAG: hypothetical protein IKU15_02120 [Clostridia bacterium]|nr:hypothetical protein [Clostridia bacterium]